MDSNGGKVNCKPECAVDARTYGSVKMGQIYSSVY